MINIRRITPLEWRSLTYPFQVFTGEVPFQHARTDGQVIWLVLKGDRPKYRAEARCLGLTSRVWSIMEECWAAEPSRRPSASQVLDRLTSVWG